MVTYAGTSFIYILQLTAIVQLQMPQSKGKGNSNQASLKVLLISFTAIVIPQEQRWSDGKTRNRTTKCSDKGHCIVGLRVPTSKSFYSYFWAAANTARWRTYLNSSC